MDKIQRRFMQASWTVSDEDKTSWVISKLAFIFEPTLNFINIEIKSHYGVSAINGPNCFDFIIKTQYEKKFVVRYFLENQFEIFDISSDVALHLKFSDNILLIQNAFTTNLEKYSLIQDFISEGYGYNPTVQNIDLDLLFSRRFSVFINLKTNSVKYQWDFRLDTNNILVSFNCLNSRFNIKYYLHDFKKLISLGKDPHISFEKCLYDLFLKERYGLHRKTKNSLLLAEMMAI